jgi:hypothetical protein
LNASGIRNHKNGKSNKYRKKAAKHKVKKTVENATDEPFGIEDDKKLKKPGKMKNGKLR